MPGMKQLIFFTESFPYGKGGSFIENEIEYLENYLNESNAAQEMIESGKALINLYNGNIYENFADELTHSLNMLNKTSFADKAENILEK